MELRGCSQVHFISVIRGGEVIKMHNIARGKSVLKFKNIKDIYGSDGSECHEFLPICPPKVNRSVATPNGEHKVKAGVKREFMEDDIELDFGTITLKQLKRTCKSKKRNASKFVKMAAVKQEVDDLPCEEDELELKETLVSWKRKVLMKAKLKKKKTSNCGSPVSEICNLGFIPKDTPKRLALVDISSEIYKPLQVKVEEPEPSYSEPQAISFILSDDYHWNSTSETTGTVECCSSDQALDKNLGHMQRGDLTQCFHENSVQPVSVDTQSCVLNQISYELLEHMGHNSVHPESSSFDEIMRIEGLKVTDQPSVCCGSESSGVEEMNDPMTCDESPERVLAECDPFVFQEYHPTVDCMASLDKLTSVVDETELGVANVTSTELQSSNCDNGDIEGETVFGTHLKNYNSTEQDKKKLPSASCDMTSLTSITLLVEDKCSSVDNCVAPLSCSPVIQPGHAVELTGSTSAGNENGMMLHPPERLFSTRRIISPTSQERLHKFMNFDEQRDGVEIHSCVEKLQYEKNEAISPTLRQDAKSPQIVSSFEKPQIMNAEELQNKGKQRIRRGKHLRKAPHSRGSVNGTQASPTSQNVGNVCSSVQMCSQNAIAFSKRQVHDIERIATKLMTGLQSMKSIVVDALQHESRTGAKFRYDTDQVRVAVENVTKAEETALRWLAMMSRDCDRFCKIMKLAEADAPSPEKPKGDNPSSPDTKIVPKERKIMFADEAGGSLCNVKVFKNFETDTDFDDTPVKRHCTRGEA